MVVFEVVFELFEGMVVTLWIVLNFFGLQTRTRPPYEAQACFHMPFREAAAYILM